MDSSKLIAFWVKEHLEEIIIFSAVYVEQILQPVHRGKMDEEVILASDYLRLTLNFLCI